MPENCPAAQTDRQTDTHVNLIYKIESFHFVNENQTKPKLKTVLEFGVVLSVVGKLLVSQI